MAEDRCRICGGPLPARERTQGRSLVYCSAACRQKAYRLRQGPAPGEGVRDLIADIERRVQRLTPRPPDTFYSDVTDLSSSVGRLRRIARVARDAATPGPDSAALVPNPTTPSRNATAVPDRDATHSPVREVTEAPGRETTGAPGQEAVTVLGGNVTDGAVTETGSEDVTPPAVTETDEVAVVRGGDEASFAGLLEPYRRELQVHCYRMVGSYDDSEDMVQETFLKAWRRRDGFEGRSTFRAWLYRIATNVCLDFLRRNTRVPQRYEPIPGMDSGSGEPPARVTWLQPYPDELLADVASDEVQPDTAAVSRETIELVFLAAIQHLPPRQRAVLILRDVLGWPAADTASLLDMSVASVNSALQRARPTLRRQLPRRRTDWSAGTGPAGEEREVLRRYMAAADRADMAAVAELLSEDVVLTMPPNPFWFVGRDAMMAFIEPSLDPASPQYAGEWRHLPTTANRQVAAGGYLRRPGTTVYRAQVLDVLRIEDGRVVEITAFEPHLFPAFGLPLTVR